MKRVRSVAAAGAIALAAGLVWLADSDDGDRYGPVFKACAQAEHIDLGRLRDPPSATAHGPPGYPTANLTVLLLPEPAGSAHCYFRMGDGGQFTLLGASRD